MKMNTMYYVRVIEYVTLSLQVYLKLHVHDYQNRNNYKGHWNKQNPIKRPKHSKKKKKKKTPKLQLTQEKKN